MKKILALIISIVLITSSAAFAETPIRWLTTGDTGATALQDGDRIIQAINERLGIELEMDIVPDGSTEKVNVAMASGDFPDIVTGAYGSAATQSWIDNGMVIALDQYLDSNPNMKTWLEDYEWTKQNDQFYGMPFITQFNAANALIYMRGDWLDALDLEYPTTLDEMKTVLSAFTFNDPDGNGINDTYGLTGTKPIGEFTWVFYAYGREYSDYSLDAEGNVIASFEGEDFIQGMKYIRELWEMGVIDPEFMLNDSTKAEEKFYQGKVGAKAGALYRHVSRIEGNLQAVTPDAYLAYGLPPVGPDGESFGLNAQGKSGFLTCITAACAAPEKAAEFIDFFISEEGNDLVRLGIKGIHYDEDENGNITLNEEERLKDSFSANGWAHAIAWGSFYWPLESNYMPVTDPNCDRAKETVVLATEAQVPSLIKQTVAAETEYSSILSDIYNEYFLNMMTGEFDIEEGTQQLINEWHANGGDELLEALNEVYNANK